jgi:hypothetical protein
MRQAIRTRYLPPTNARSARIRAKCDAKTMLVYWNESKSTDENHAYAASNLARVLGWKGRWSGAYLRGEGVFVIEDSDSFTVE